MAKRELISLRLRPGERKVLDLAKLILEREGDQDITQTLVRQSLREVLLSPEYNARRERLGIDVDEALLTLDADLAALASVDLRRQ